MKTTHPEINRRQCWNLHPHRTPARPARTSAPFGEAIFTRPNLVKDWDPAPTADCVSARRAAALVLPPEQVQPDTAAADSDNDTIWIGCEKSARKTPWCAAASVRFGEALAYLALNKKIVLDLTPAGSARTTCAPSSRVRN